MRAATSRTPKPALGLAWRIFTAMSLVVIAGAGTLLVSALLVARPVFHAHLDQIKPLVSAPAQAHVDEAFSNAVLIALSVGVTAALAAALIVTWLVAMRVAAPVAEAAEAAQRIADGDYQTRLRQPRLGPEFDRLTTAFNLMARRLATTDQTRRHLLADLAHELRTPLASMQATIEAINDGILPSDQTTLATLTEQSQRLHRLVGDLSAVSRAEERQLNLHPVLVSAEDLVSGAVTAARPRFDAKGSASPPRPPSPPARCWSTPTGWPRLWAHCSTTPCGIRPWQAPSPSPPPVTTTGAGSWCPTTAKASTPPSPTSCSSASTGATPPAPPAAPEAASG